MPNAQELADRIKQVLFQSYQGRYLFDYVGRRFDECLKGFLPDLPRVGQFMTVACHRYVGLYFEGDEDPQMKPQKLVLVVVHSSLKGVEFARVISDLCSDGGYDADDIEKLETVSPNAKQEEEMRRNLRRQVDQAMERVAIYATVVARSSEALAEIV